MTGLTRRKFEGEEGFMKIKPIKNDEDYQQALTEIECLFDAAPDTPAGDRLDVLTTLVEAYEQKYHAIPAPDPVEAIKYWMESRGITRQDLEPLLGSRARISEIFNHKRGLTLAMIRKLHDKLGIPAEALIQPSALRHA
jgi:HTH-type transcriptional regulator / antitoxin HigA